MSLIIRWGWIYMLKLCHGGYVGHHGTAPIWELERGHPWGGVSDGRAAGCSVGAISSGGPTHSFLLLLSLCLGIRRYRRQ